MQEHSYTKGFLVFTTYLVICFLSSNCRSAKAKFQEDQGNMHNIELALTENQVSFLKDQAPKLLIWDHFWTGSLTIEKNRQLYQEYVGKELPVKMISTPVAVIVYIPELFPSAITYVKMPDGQLDYPGISSWLEINQKQEIPRSIKTLPSSTGLGAFVLLLSSSEGKELNFSEDQKKPYLTLSDKYFPTAPKTPEIPYWEMDSSITLLPIREPSFEAMTEDKEILLNKILKKAIQESKKSYDKGTHATITVPNFNIGDPIIRILIEAKNKEHIQIDLQLNLNPKQEPIVLAGFHIVAESGGIRGDIVKKIKQTAIKTFEFVVD